MRVSVCSPGFWDFAASLSPLETLRKYVSDRHERKKDESYRSRLESDRLTLENEQLKTRVVREQVQLLKELQIPEDRIRQAVTRYVIEPLSKLDGHQDAARLTTAEIVDDEDSAQR